MIPIRSGDENAIEKLQAKAQRLKADQEQMKAANKYFKAYNTMKGYGTLNDEQAERWDKRIWETFEKKPYASYELTNNNQSRHAVEKRIKALEAENSIAEGDNEYDTEHLGFRVEENKKDLRLRLFFDDIPSKKLRESLKRYGFKWSPKNEAWQRLLNQNARSSLKWLIRSMESQNAMEM